MIGGHPKPVVLKYSKRRARIYYVDSSSGNVITFEKRTKNGLWNHGMRQFGQKQEVQTDSFGH